MAQMRCSECGTEIPRSDWICPNCDNPEPVKSEPQPDQHITTGGITILLLLFVGVPVLLFILHIFVPEL